jgi:hypothetical protein
MKYACPSCGFRVISRRCSKCEHCGRELPQELLFSAAQIERLNADAEASRRAQAARAATEPGALRPQPGFGVADGIWIADVIADIAQDFTNDPN